MVLNSQKSALEGELSEKKVVCKGAAMLVDPLVHRISLPSNVQGLRQSQKLCVALKQLSLSSSALGPF